MENENIVQEQDVQTETDCEEKKQGILSEYKIAHDAKLAKKEKHKTALQFVKYALCAASAGIIQFVSFTILQAVIPSGGKTIHFIVEDMDIGTFIATTVALCLSVLRNFTLNRKFTFKDAGNVPRAMILAFLLYVPFYPFQTWCVHSVKTALGVYIALDFAGIIAEAVAMICNFVLEFFWQKFVVFRKKKEKKSAQNEDGQATEDGQINEDGQATEDCQINEEEQAIEEAPADKEE